MGPQMPPIPAAGRTSDLDMDLKHRASSAGGSTYGNTISSSPPTLSPTTTLSSLCSHPSMSHTQEHSFPYLSSYISNPQRPPPPPPSEISNLSRNSTIPTSPYSSSSTSPLQYTQTQPNLAPNSSHPPSSSSSPSQQRQRRRHQSESSVPTISTNITSSPSSPSSPPLRPGLDPLRSDSWIQKKHRNSSGSSPGGFGRHGDEWLFGGISLTQTAREIVTRRAKKRHDS